MRSLRGHARRWIRPGLLALLTMVTLGLGVAVLVVRSQDTTDQLVGVGGLFVGLASLAVSLVQLPSSLPPSPEPEELADYLAVTVREQWEEEVTARQLRDPRVIPLSWSATERPVAGPPDSVVSPVGARVLRLSMNGRLDGRFDEAAARLAEGYRRVPSGRLVVLGEPGAGKTVLAVMLTLGILSQRGPQAPVPVLLSVSTWDPVSESLDDWVVGTVAVAYYGGRPDIPRRLLARRLLLPVLDGLDEIPEVARRSAVRAVNDACGDGRSIVLTCRSAEYEDVIKGGSPVLHRAPVVEIVPVPVDDAITYLQDVSWPAGVVWDEVYDHLRADPASPLAVALSTPLTLSLARTVYRHCNRDPRELLVFDSRHAAEDHLIDHVIPAAYAPRPGSIGQADSGTAWQQRAGQAERWLTYLATYLHQYRERDLAWWLMSRRLLSRWFGLAFGIALGLTMMIALVAVSEFLAKIDVLDVAGIADTAYPTGIGSAVLAMLTWYAAPDMPPGRLSFTVRGSLGRLRRGAATGAALVAIPATPVLVTAAVVITLSGGWPAERIVRFLQAVAAVAGVTLALALAMAVRNWLDAPPERSTAASPLGLLRQDRVSSLAGASAAGAVLGITAVPLLILSLSAGWIVLHALTGSVSHEPPPFTVILHFTRQGRYYSTPGASTGLTLLPAALFALLVLATRAWTRFLLLRLVLAVHGKLPWHLTRFLADARDRQLLRQSAGTYQFRHIRLQERLASRSLAGDRESELLTRAVRRRRIQAAVACAALLVSGLTLVKALPHDSSHVILFTGNVDAMALDPKGKTLVTVSGGDVRWWDTATGRKTREAESPLTPLSEELSLAVRADGDVVITALDNEGLDVVELGVDWTQRTFTSPVGAYPGSGPVLDARGSRLAVSSASTGVMVDERTGRVVRRWQGPGAPVALNADGTRLATAWHGHVSVRDLYPHRGTRRRTVTIPVPGGRDGHYVVAMSADGRRLATAEGYTVQLWDPADGKATERLTGPTSDISTLTLSADGRIMAATADGTTRLWHLPAP